MAHSITIGIIKEGKIPVDKRVPLTPDQCRIVMERFPQVRVIVQSSDVRAFADDEYRAQGIDVVDDISAAEIILGVKEVPVEMLIPGKTFLFFSHTYKMQEYNRDLLRAILSKRIRLIDYELMTYASGSRVLGFGRYAGIVGCYSGLRGWGKKFQDYSLKPATECSDRREVNRELEKVKLPNNFKLVLTGLGRVGHGAREVLEHVGIREVSPAEFLTVDDFEEPVFTNIHVNDYYKRKDQQPFKRREVYENPDAFESNFKPFVQHADMYIAGHYWDTNAPFIFTREDARHPDCRIKMVADISCDIDGPIASTIRPSTTDDPFYGYDPKTEKETDFHKPGSIGVMAVDNLPGELPKDASEDFGNDLIEKVFPALLSDDEEGIITRATETTLSGHLTENYRYLIDWVGHEYA